MPRFVNKNKRQNNFYMPETNFTGSLLYSSNPILKQTFEFALGIVQYSEMLEREKKYVFARQILRSGTSIGANVKEAQNAESKADFVHKMKIALKEADETEYWLKLCMHLDNYPQPVNMSPKLESIIEILNKIIGTTKRSQKHSLIR
jgi:four helix bundle protein